MSNALRDFEQVTGYAHITNALAQWIRDKGGYNVAYVHQIHRELSQITEMYRDGKRTSRVCTEEDRPAGSVGVGSPSGGSDTCLSADYFWSQKYRSADRDIDPEYAERARE